ncbi:MULTISPECIES: hypothetical protein [unclassified Micromonospora]|uniref:hypothetical protein n=1 Tax=unclassified Micromonospora TaxID=2617518 RepID=UPI002FF04A1E
MTGRDPGIERFLADTEPDGWMSRPAGRRRPGLVVEGDLDVVSDAPEDADSVDGGSRDGLGACDGDHGGATRRRQT